MTRTKALAIMALALVALAAVGCGGGRSILLAPPRDSTKNDARPGADASHDVRPEPLSPDAGPALPDVREDTLPLPPDGRPILPEVGPGPDTVEVRPPLPDAGPDLLPPPADLRTELPPLPPLDAKVDLLPPPLDLKPDSLPPPLDLKPDLLPPPLDLKPDLLPLPIDLKPDLPPASPDLARPDTRPANPDGLTPFRLCTSGEACSSDCTTICQTFGTSACSCVGGVLVCGACQPPRIRLTFTPCPDNASGTACDSSGLACPIYSNGGLSGICACLELGSGTRWNCI